MLGDTIFANLPHPVKKADMTKDISQSISTWELSKSLSTLKKKKVIMGKEHLVPMLTDQIRNSESFD